MRNLVLVLAALIAAVTFLRAYEGDEAAEGMMAPAIELPLPSGE